MEPLDPRGGRHPLGLGWSRFLYPRRVGLRLGHGLPRAARARRSPWASRASAPGPEGPGGAGGPDEGQEVLAGHRPDVHEEPGDGGPRRARPLTSSTSPPSTRTMAWPSRGQASAAGVGGRHRAGRQVEDAAQADVAAAGERVEPLDEPTGVAACGRRGRSPAARRLAQRVTCRRRPRAHSGDPAHEVPGAAWRLVARGSVQPQGPVVHARQVRAQSAGEPLAAARRHSAAVGSRRPRQAA